MAETLPTVVDQSVEYEDFYETTLALPLSPSDTDIFPTTLPGSASGFLVIDPKGAAPEIIFFNDKGLNFVRCPSASDGEGRGVFNTTPGTYEQGTTIGMYSTAAFFEGIVTGKTMRDGFLQARHFSSSVNPNAYIGAGETLAYSSYIGNRVAAYTIAGDVREKYTNGVRLKLPRVMLPSTECGSFAIGSSQYASRPSASVSGLSFTDDFTCEADIKLNSLPGTVQTIVARRDGSNNGFQLRIETNGQIGIYGLSSGSYRACISNQSLFITGTWVHVAGSLNMSGNTGAIYIDGVAIDTHMVASGTPSALTQAGDLSVGAWTGGNELFDGEIAEVRVWNAIRTANQVRDNCTVILTGSESNLVSYIKLAGDFSDSSSNGNTLTASGGATATFANNPFSATELGIVVSSSFSSGNTTLYVYSGNKFVPPAENITNASYSYTKVPPGFPLDPNLWTLIATDKSTGNKAVDVYYNLSLLIPMGAWNIFGNISAKATSNASNNARFAGGLSTTDNSVTELQTLSACELSLTSGGTSNSIGSEISFGPYPVVLDSLTIYYLNLKSDSGTLSPNNVETLTGKIAVLKAVCAYL